MPSYKRIYIFEEILYIISSKYCIFKKASKSMQIKKERQSLTSLTQLVRNTYMFNY